MKGCVYIIKSLKSGYYYVGSSCNVFERVKQHNYGLVESTRNRKPYKLVFNQEFSSIEEAKKIEKRIKSWKRKDFIGKIIRDGKIDLGA